MVVPQLYCSPSTEKVTEKIKGPPRLDVCIKTMQFVFLKRHITFVPIPFFGPLSTGQKSSSVSQKLSSPQKMHLKQKSQI